ncbi:MAG: sugar ABC transporter substrate-binding protein [Candidatus Nanopelagicales bacterium]
MRKLRALVALLFASTLLLAACGSTEDAGPVKVSMWSHAAGNEQEIATVKEAIADFNASQSDYEVVLEEFPQESYNDSIIAAATSDSLPCIVDVDGPIMPNWAWAGYMQPISIDSTLEGSLLAGAKGYYNGELYSVGAWDAALGILTLKSYLDEAGVRVPTVDSPWTQAEFDSALEALDDLGKFDYALDWGNGWTGEWFPYAYSPLLQSFGGDLINRDDYLSADGVVNGAEAIAFGEWFQSTFEDGYANPKQSGDRTEFVNGTIAIQYNGNWAVKDAYAKFGDDLLILPPPDFGNGPKIGAASWQFGVSSSCDQVEGATAFIEYILQDKYVVAFANRIGLIPATAAATAEVPDYADGGVFSVFVEFSNNYAVKRPETPAYLFISKAFEKAVADIINGGDVKRALDTAADEIDRDIADNGNYE